MADELRNILRVAEKHPYSRISKLIRLVQEEPSQRNVVLLLIELAEHTEYSTEFDISLSYYLNLFDQLGMQQVLFLNEAGLLLVNSSKIYARRVDYVHNLVEQQILTLSDKATIEEKIENGGSHRVEEISRNLRSESLARNIRKRPLEISSDPYEIELIPKKIRKLCIEKRFCQPKQVAKTKTVLCLDIGQYLHPANWLCGTIFDLENEDDVDSKRNYKLFTYHIEHRYNTLVPDVNFRLFFKVKDFMGGEREAVHFRNRVWPLSSEKYVQKYVRLENIVHQQSITVLRESVVTNAFTRKDDPTNDNPATLNSNIHSKNLSEENSLNNISTLSNEQSIFGDINTLKENIQPLAVNILQIISNTNDNTCRQAETTGDVNRSISKDFNETVHSNELSATITTSLLVETMRHGVTSSTLNEIIKPELSSHTNSEITLEASKASVTSIFRHEQPSLEESSIMSKNGSEDNVNLNEIRVHLPHLDDEGVYFSDLDDIDQRMLSPKIVAKDVMPCVPDKDKITIIVDDEIKEIFNIREELAKYRPLPVAPININILQLPEKCLRKRILFKLGPDMELFLKARIGKRLRLTESSNTPTYHREHRNNYLQNVNVSEICMNWDNSLTCSEFLGFSDDSNSDKSGCDEQDFLGFTEVIGEQSDDDITARFSQDSGVGADVNLLLKSMIDYVATKIDNESEEFINDKFNKDTDHDNKSKHLRSEISSNHEPSLFLNRSENIENNKMGGITSKNKASFLYNIQPNTGQESNAIDTTIVFNSDERAHNWNGDNSTTMLEMQAAKTKIQEWHDSLRPILIKSRERHHFDVFQLGSEIIEAIQNKSASDSFIQRHNEINNEIYTPSATFMDIMGDKDKSYASRYFLSSLLLANQNNIEFKLHSQNSEEPSNWCDVNMKLINCKRHTISIDDNIGVVTANDVSSRNEIFEKEILRRKRTLSINSPLENKNINKICKAQKRSMSIKRVNYAKKRLILETEKHHNYSLNTNETKTQSSHIEDTALRDNQRLQTTITPICSIPLAKQIIEIGETKSQCSAETINFRDFNIKSFIAQPSASTDVNPTNFFPMTGFSPPVTSDATYINSDKHIPFNGTISKQSLDAPSTSNQAKRSEQNPICYFVEPNITVKSMQALLNAKKVKLNLVKPLKKIEKAHRQSDDLDSGIFSNDDFPINS